MRSEQGFSLVEVIIAASIMAIIGLAGATMIINQMKHFKEMENKFSVMALQDEIKSVLGSKHFCDGAMRANASTLATYAPPTDITQAYEVDIPQLYFGDSLLIEAGGIRSGLEVMSIKLIRKVGVPIKNFDYTSEKTGITTNVNSHAATLAVKLKYLAGVRQGQERENRQHVQILSTNAGNRIMSCEADQTVKLQRAIASREGAAVHYRDCLDPVPANYYQANSCADSDSDGLCDSNTELAVRANRVFDNGLRPASFWQNVSSTTVGTPASIGRCPVTVVANTSNEEDNDIFLVRQFTSSLLPFQGDGLGCNTANGWYLTSCTRADWGSGESDTTIYKNATGEYCHTNDFAQPHNTRYTNKAWALSSVKVTVICTKFE